MTGSSKLAVATADQRLNFSGKANSEKRVTLVVGNSGTAAVEAVQFAATPPSGWTVTFDPPTVDEVKPNETTQVVASSSRRRTPLPVTMTACGPAPAANRRPRPALRREGSQTLGIVAIASSPRLPRCLRGVFSFRASRLDGRQRRVGDRRSVPHRSRSGAHGFRPASRPAISPSGTATNARQPADLQIDRGEIFGLLGPNGAGKTTTILMLLGSPSPPVEQHESTVSILDGTLWPSSAGSAICPTMSASTTM